MQSINNPAFGTVLGGGCAMQSAETRQPEIREQVEILNNEASEIAAYIAGIEERFGAVLQPTSPKNEACGGAIPYFTPLGGELGALAERLRASRHRLEGILQRAEL